MCNSFWPAIELTGESPARVVWSAENVTSEPTTPSLFEKHYLPFYNDVADMMHANGKLYGVHFDGNLAALKDLIARTALDIIEGFTPPPMGDLDLKEAMGVWPGIEIENGHFGGESFHDCLYQPHLNPPQSWGRSSFPATRWF